MPVVQNLFCCPLFIGYGIAGNRATHRIPCTSHDCRIAASRFGLEHSWPYALSRYRLSDSNWESPQSVQKVTAVLEKHPWYAHQWQARLQDVPAADHGRVLFMQAARWPDDIRTQDKVQNRPPWHYINLPFKPEGQPANVQVRDPEPVNILTAMAENESVKKESNPAKGNRAFVALPSRAHGTAIHY